MGCLFSISIIFVLHLVFLIKPVLPGILFVIPVALVLKLVSLTKPMVLGTFSSTSSSFFLYVV